MFLFSSARGGQERGSQTPRCPWDPALLVLTEVKSLSCVHPTLCNPMDWSPPGLLHPWNFLGKSAGVGCHFLLQGGASLVAQLVKNPFAMWET